jgi:hypothetical protein
MEEPPGGWGFAGQAFLNALENDDTEERRRADERTESFIEPQLQMKFEPGKVTYQRGQAEDVDRWICSTERLQNISKRMSLPPDLYEIWRKQRDLYDKWFGKNEEATKQMMLRDAYNESDIALLEDRAAHKQHRSEKKGRIRDKLGMTTDEDRRQYLMRKLDRMKEERLDEKERFGHKLVRDEMRLNPVWSATPKEERQAERARRIQLVSDELRDPELRKGRWRMTLDAEKKLRHWDIERIFLEWREQQKQWFMRKRKIKEWAFNP